ncbi:amino acid adenylation domain-containing protein [Streptomyces sp. NBC_00893]|uniref:non-ribosomal peptide synthetase n=1 Tax=Streptomyces sp. NBC_00893 TaxID=2975862 RepID=UPI002255F4A3|nr:amino acid adenylation domain-containing protein [Streptomyces sp. NBC_00893]MCX4849519.1 amino acid adenylation domain-containing protein [Streptomyces sp. NBC_00893]
MTKLHPGRDEGASDRTSAAAARQEHIRRLLAERGFGREDGSCEADRFPRLGPGPHPLSSAQRRMWFAQQRGPDSASYNICVGFRISGELDPARLRRAFESVVAHQDILRTVYRTDADGLPVQLVLPSIDLPWETVDCRALPAGTDAEDEVERLAGEHGRPAFDLTKDCPLRALLLGLGAREHVLVLSAHHIAIDDQSWAPLLHTAAERYRSGPSGHEAGRPPSPVTYARFADWEQRRVTSGEFDESLSYWRGRLDPWPAPTALPMAGGVGGERSEKGVRRRLALSPRTGAGITALAKDSGASLFMTTLACLTAVLSRYSGSGDLAVGTVAVHRPSPELEPLVGNFGNTLMLRFDAGGDPRFTDLLAEVQQRCIDAFGQQEVPFDQVVEAVRPPRERDGSGLFNVMFTQRGLTLPHDIDFPGQRWQEIAVFNGTTRFDLAVEVVSGPDGLVLTGTGAHRMFDAEGVDRVLGHLATLMDGVLAAPTSRLSELPLLPDAEYERVVHEWNATDRPEYLPRTTLPGLFAEQVRRRPDAEALVFGDQRLSYAELDGRANRLARHLAASGVSPGGLVGVLLERSPELVVAMLAALKAGAAFVPFDPAWPALRKQELISTAGLSACVTTGSLLSRDELAGMAASVAHVDLTADADLVAGHERHATDIEAALSDVAYVIYTSGSTGVPKGAMITHAGIVNRLPWQADLLELTDSDTVLHKAPVSFDVSINEIFLPLASGCRLVLAEPGGEGDVSYLLSTIAEHRVTFVYLVSSMLDLMVERDDAAEAFRSLRHVWCGGEVLSPELYLRFRQQCGARMYHGYGPAEATIGVTCRVYESADHVRTVTIGRPNPNTRIYLLDGARKPVPVGTVGEIHIGGLPLARGYLNDPVRTAERFIDDPFLPGERLYRTGDLARHRADGQIEFVGRADNQVKLNGRRIELEEIESRLASHPGVRQAAVMIRTRGRLGRQLVAFVATGDSAITPEELRSWLTERVPSYMVPPTVVLMPELPLKSSGKVDRDELGSADLPEDERKKTAYTAPQGALQEAVAAIWARLLGVEQVGVHENFFDLGGHSLLVVKVQTEIRRELGHDVPVVALFENPTVAAVARRLDTDAGAAGDEEAREVDRIRGRADRQRRARAGRGRTSSVKEAS